MKLRGINLIVNDLEAEALFWQRFLAATPRHKDEGWIEFKSGSLTFGLQKASEGTESQTCRPVFEYLDIEFEHYVEKALSLGATLVADLKNDPHHRGMLLADPEGHQFEISRRHD